MSVTHQDTDYKRLLAELCDCTTIDTSRRGEQCRQCGKRIISKLEESWLFRNCGLGHKVYP